MASFIEMLYSLASRRASIESTVSEIDTDNSASVTRSPSTTTLSSSTDHSNASNSDAESSAPIAFAQSTQSLERRRHGRRSRATMTMLPLYPSSDGVRVLGKSL